MVSYTTNIKVPIEKVWQHFIYKIEHPENFVPGVSNVIIKEKTADFVIRDMDIILLDGSKATLTEKITHAPYTVKFSIINHPVYSGYVDNLAEKISDNETKITFSLHWINKQSGEPFSNPEIAKNAVLKTVDYILQHV
jgi:hypothetical protein